MVNMLATKIRMRQGFTNSQDLLDIDSIYLDGCEGPGFFKKEAIHDYLTICPNTIHVGIPPYPALIPAINSLDEKYVKSTPNDTVSDNLLSLPRE